MRIRSVKPEFWTDSVIVQLPYEARLLFIGIWNAADDHGWIEEEPERIKLQLLPVDPLDIEATLDLLVAVNLLERHLFEDGSVWLQVRTWKKHQRVDHPSKTRRPEGDSRRLAIPQASRRALAMKYGCAPGERKEVACYYCGTPGTIFWHKLYSGRPSGWVSFSLTIDHFVPVTSGGDEQAPNLVLACRHCNASKGNKQPLEFLAPHESSRDLAPEREGEKEKEVEKEKRKKNTSPTAVAVVSDLDSDFDAAWRAYPRRPGDSRSKARKAYLARRKAGVTAEELHAGVQAYAAHVTRERTDPKFIKQAATFFGPDEHWRADWGPATARKSPGEEMFERAMRVAGEEAA